MSSATCAQAPSNKLREIRTARGLSYTELATMAGVTRPTIYRLESGERRGLHVTHRCIAAALDVPVADVFPTAA